jgi:hypothetical protein
MRNGQGVLNVLQLATVKSEIDAAIVQLRPESSAPADTARRRVAR